MSAILLFVSCLSLAQEVTVQNVPPAAKADSLKMHGKSLLSQKNDYKIDHDIKLPFLINGNGGNGNNLIYHSILTGYQDGLPSRLIHASPVLETVKNHPTIKGYRIGYFNTSLKNIFRLAHYNGKKMFRDNEVLIEVEKPLKLSPKTNIIQEQIKWMQAGNVYSYEAITPYSLGRKAAYSQMREDLSKFFPQYKAGREKRKVPCLLLVRTSNTDKIASKGGEVVCEIGTTGFIMRNYHPPSYFIESLHFYLQDMPPLIDETDYSGKVDIEINANLHDIEAINRELQKYDLKIIEGEREIEMLVIKDSGTLSLPLVMDYDDVSVEKKQEDWLSLEERGIK